MVSVDRFSNENYIAGDFQKIEVARKICEDKTKDQQIIRCYVYDDKGKCVYKAGTY